MWVLMNSLSMNWVSTIRQYANAQVGNSSPRARESLLIHDLEVIAGIQTQVLELCFIQVLESLPPEVLKIA